MSRRINIIKKRIENREKRIEKYKDSIKKEQEGLKKDKQTLLNLKYDNVLKKLLKYDVDPEVLESAIEEEVEKKVFKENEEGDYNEY